MQRQQSASLPVSSRSGGIHVPLNTRGAVILVEDEDDEWDQTTIAGSREDASASASVSPSPGTAMMMKAHASVPGRVPLLVGSFSSHDDGRGAAAVDDGRRPEQKSFGSDAQAMFMDAHSNEADDLEGPLLGSRQPSPAWSADASPEGGLQDAQLHPPKLMGMSANWLTPELARGLLYGVINFIVMVPTLVSYAGIVLRAPLYKQYPYLMPRFISLMYLSSACQQIVFSLLSPLTFAIGQVQDVGLILISAIATDVAVRGSAAGLGIDAIVRAQPDTHAHTYTQR